MKLCMGIIVSSLPYSLVLSHQTNADGVESDRIYRSVSTLTWARSCWTSSRDMWNDGSSFLGSERLRGDKGGKNTWLFCSFLFKVMEMKHRLPVSWGLHLFWVPYVVTFGICNSLIPELVQGTTSLQRYTCLTTSLGSRLDCLWLLVSASCQKLVTTQKACFKQPREYAPGKESENQQLWRGYRYIDIYDDRSHANRIHLCRSHYCLWVIDDDLQLTIVSRMRGKPSHMVHEHPIAYAVEDHIEPDNVQTFLPKQLLNPALNVTYAVVGAQFLRRGGFAF